MPSHGSHVPVLFVFTFKAFLPLPGAAKQPGHAGPLQHRLRVGPGELTARLGKKSGFNPLVKVLMKRIVVETRYV